MSLPPNHDNPPYYHKEPNRKSNNWKIGIKLNWQFGVDCEARRFLESL
jgi:hypothetical protein